MRIPKDYCKSGYLKNYRYVTKSSFFLKGITINLNNIKVHVFNTSNYLKSYIQNGYDHVTIDYITDHPVLLHDGYRVRIRAVSVPCTASCTPVAGNVSAGRWRFHLLTSSALCYSTALLWVPWRTNVRYKQLRHQSQYKSHLLLRNSTAVFLLAVNITFFIYDTVYSMFRPSMFAILRPKTYKTTWRS